MEYIDTYRYKDYIKLTKSGIEENSLRWLSKI